MYESVSEVGMFVQLASQRGRVGVVVNGCGHSRVVLWLDDYSMSTHRYSELVEGQKPSHNSAMDAIALLVNVNKEIFDNPKSSCGELRCGSYLHSQINAVVAEQQHQ